MLVKEAPDGSIRLFAQRTSLSPICRLIWKHWSYKIFSGYILSRVCPDKVIHLSYLFCNMWAVCIQLTHLSFIYRWLLEWCTSSYFIVTRSKKMNQKPLFRVRTWHNRIGYMSCYIFRKHGSNPLHKNIERHTAHTVVSWPLRVKFAHHRCTD